MAFWPWKELSNLVRIGWGLRSKGTISAIAVAAMTLKDTFRWLGIDVDSSHDEDDGDCNGHGGDRKGRDTVTVASINLFR